jgi:hypothetical protein
VAREPAPPLATGPLGLPAEAAGRVAALVASLLAKPAAGRPADAGAVAQALAQAGSTAGPQDQVPPQQDTTVAEAARGAPSHLPGSRAP